MFDPKDSIMDTTNSDIKAIKEEFKKLKPSEMKFAHKAEKLAGCKQRMLHQKTQLIVDVLKGLTLKDAQKVLSDVNEKIISITVIPFEKE